MAKGKGIGLWERMGVELDKGTVQAMMSEYENALATSGEKGARAMERALKETHALTVAKLEKQLRDGLINEKTFSKLKAEADRGFAQSLGKGMDDLKAKGKLTDAEFVKLSKTLSKLESQSKDTGSSFKGMMQGFIGGLAAGAMTAGIDALLRGVGAVKGFIFGASQAATEAEDVVNSLAGTLERFGVRFASVRGELESNARLFQDRTVFDDETYLGIIDALTEKTGSYTAALRDAETVANVMYKRKLDLATASDVVSKALRNPEMSLEKVKIQAWEGEKAIDAIRRAFDGAAEGGTKTFSGQLAQLTNGWGNFKEAAGEALNNLAVKLGILPKATAWLRENTDEMVAWVETTGAKMETWWKTNREDVQQTIRDVQQLASDLKSIAAMVLPPVRVVVEFVAKLARWYNKVDRWEDKYLYGPEPGVPVDHGHTGRPQAEIDHSHTPAARQGRNRQPKGTGTGTGTGTRAKPLTEDERTEREIALLAEVAKMRRLEADELAKLEGYQDRARARLSATNLGLAEEVRLRERLAKIITTMVAGGVPAPDLAPATIITPVRKPFGTYHTPDERAEQRSVAAMRQQLELLGDIGQWRRLNRDEIDAAAKLEGDIERKLRNQNLSARERLELEQNLAVAREMNAGDFTMDNVWEVMAGSARAAGDSIGDAWTDNFERIFEDGLDLKSFMDGMWAGTSAGLAKAIAGEARLRAKHNTVKAVEAGAEGLLAVAKREPDAAAAAFSSAGKFLLSAAGWAALGGAAGAAGGHGSSRGGGHSPMERGGPDAGHDIGRRVETHTYIRLEAKFDPFDPNSPRHQDLIHTTARNVIDTQGRDAFTRGNAAE